MKDIVVKTVLITLASLFGVFLVAFGALAMFAPGTLAEVFDGTGGYSSSILFYEKQYDKTKDIEDLAILVVKINPELDLELAEKYYNELVNHEKFEEFCANGQGDVLSNKEFYVGKYALTLFKNDKLDSALVVASDFVKENGYTLFNPYSVLLIEQGGEFSKAELEQIKDEILAYSGEDKANTTHDLKLVDDLIAKK